MNSSVLHFCDLHHLLGLKSLNINGCGRRMLYHTIMVHDDCFICFTCYSWYYDEVSLEIVFVWDYLLSDIVMYADNLHYWVIMASKRSLFVDHNCRVCYKVCQILSNSIYISHTQHQYLHLQHSIHKSPLPWLNNDGSKLVTGVC